MASRPFSYFSRKMMMAGIDDARPPEGLDYDHPLTALQHFPAARGADSRGWA
jgi:hypothetical protein